MTCPVSRSGAPGSSGDSTLLVRATGQRDVELSACGADRNRERLAVQVEHGFGHTALMFSRNIDKLSEMARRINTSIFVKNGPSFAGLGMGGEGYSSFTIASPTGEGMTTARSFTRFRRCTLIDAFRIV